MSVVLHNLIFDQPALILFISFKTEDYPNLFYFNLDYFYEETCIVTGQKWVFVAYPHSDARWLTISK